MNKYLIPILLTLLLMHLQSPAAAIAPAMPKKDLWRNSNTIVKGKVTKVICTGEVIKEFCATLTGYQATVKVSSVLKGEPYDALNLHFYKYDFNRQCMGTQDTRHYRGEEAVYYLICNDNKCRFTHWNGVEYIKKGKKVLPRCQKRK